MEYFTTEVEFETEIENPKGEEYGDITVYVNAIVYVDEDGEHADILSVCDEEENDLTEYAVNNYGCRLEDEAIKDAEVNLVDFLPTNLKYRY